MIDDAKPDRDRLDAAIEEMACDSEFTPLVRRVACLRGVSTLTGFALAVEIGDWHRFTGNTHRFLRRTGAVRVLLRFRRVQGSITKTGNTHVRRLLVEAAWHHRAPVPSWARRCVIAGRWPRRLHRARGDEGNRRLHARWVGFLERRKRSTVADVAIARELAGWCWSLRQVLQE